MLASAAIRHLVVEFQTSIELGRHIKATNGECIDTSPNTNTDRQAGVGTLGARTRNDLSKTESTALNITTLAVVVVVLTGPATTEVEAGVGSKRADGGVAPIPTRGLLWGTLVHNVSGAREGLGAGPLRAVVEGDTTTEAEAEGGRSLLDAGGGDQDGKGRLHLESFLRNYFRAIANVVRCYKQIKFKKNIKNQL